MNKDEIDFVFDSLNMILRFAHFIIKVTPTNDPSLFDNLKLSMANLGSFHNDFEKYLKGEKNESH